MTDAFVKLKEHRKAIREGTNYTEEQILGVYRGAIEGKSHKVISRETGVPWRRIAAIITGQTYRRYAPQLDRLLAEAGITDSAAEE